MASHQSKKKTKTKNLTCWECTCAFPQSPKDTKSDLREPIFNTSRCPSEKMKELHREDRRFSTWR